MLPPVLLVLAVMMQGTGREVAPLSGRVLGVDGSPIAGAVVIASGETGDDDAPGPTARTTTDDRGDFRLDRPEASDPAAPVTLWAIRPGSRVARQRIRGGGGEGPVRLTLKAAGDASVVVLDPDSRPVAGARVVPRQVVGEPRTIPGEVADLAGATTDAEGQARLPGLFAEDLAGVEIRAKGFGIQRRQFRTPDGKPSVDPRRVVLRATGTVSGRVTAEDPEAAVGRIVRVTTMAGDRGESIVAEAEATTDASGKFELAEVASGRVSIRVRPRAGSPDIPARVLRRDLAKGGEVDVEVRLRRGVRVFGFVREEGGDRPVPGAVLSLLPSGQFEPDPARTDAQGRYEAYVPPGSISHRITSVPAPYLKPPGFVTPRPVEVPAGISGFELPPVFLTRGAEVRGTVVDPGGRPAAGVQVDASWNFFDGRLRSPMLATAVSGPDGSFSVGPVHPTAELRLVASSPAGTSPPLPIHAADPDAPRLQLVASPARALTGRVVDPDGRPVAGASVRTWYRDHSSDSATWIEAKTDDEGRYRTRPLPLDGREYHAVAGAEGFQAGRTRTIRPGRADEPAFPDLVLARLTRKVVLDGRVVDRAGMPIPGVEVWTWGEAARDVRAITDGSGAFRLADVAAGPGFLFASASGFRFAGRAIDAGHAAATVPDLVLTRTAEAAPSNMVARPIDPKHRALARTTIGLLVEPAMARGDVAARVRILEAFAGVDPERVLALIEARSIRDSWLVDHLRCVAARGLLPLDPARASAAFAAIRDPESRISVELDACLAARKDDRDARRTWLERARQDADAIRDPAGRASALIRVAGHWLDLGDADRGAELLRDARAIVDTLPGVARGAQSRGAYAECVARLAPAEAMAMIETLVDPIALDRCRIGVARALAATDPVAAGRLIAAIRDPRALAADLPALCHAMAPVDPGLARSLIGRVRPASDPCLAPFSLGLMAQAVAVADRDAAEAWLREAFDLLDAAPIPVGVQAVEADAMSHDPAVVAAALLAVVERVDPSLVPEFFWRSIAIRGPRPPGEAASDASLIPLLARYDGEAAATLFEPLAARVRSGLEGDPCSWVAAAVAIDPDRALALIDSIPASPDQGTRQPRSEACLALATSLCGTASDAREGSIDGLLSFWSGGATGDR
ncbi:carboxypeptidase regulatory-like domain-containing protein [Tundrisphaera sp. TA3]|uniref:carboxypeptidase regulatory-like domain-containing protein n=1 Tax=Tundrisphaera sp. TA3 TaxID=3435775 RepID=UPI003EBD2CAC